MTGSSGDTFVTTVAANGATSLVTTDAAAAAAHLQITADGTVDINSTGDLTLNSSTDIILDADGGEIVFKDAGTDIGKIILDSNGGDFIFSSRVSDKDIVFTGNDGGSLTEVVRIDMSAAGEATFNAGVIGTSFNNIPFYSADTSSIYTTDVSGTDDTASGNSAYGYQAMDAITTGDNNVAAGTSAVRGKHYRCCKYWSW